MSGLYDPVIWIPAIVSILTTLVAVAPLYRQWWRERKDVERIDLELEKGYEPSIHPVNSLYRLTILHPSRTIEHCKVFLNNSPLPFNESRLIYDRKIPQMSAGNLRIPEDVRRDDAWVIVKNGDEEIKRQKFRDIPYDSTGLPPTH